MTVTEKLGALGSWSVLLSDHTPEDVRARLDYFGHVAIVRGRVNPADHGDTLLRAARYVGVMRRRQGQQEMELSGAGMVFWLGDEDDKGAVLEDKVTLTDASLAQAVQAILDLCPAVQLGQVLASPAGTYTGTHQWQTPRQALQVICDAFGVEFRVNGDATVDVGTRAQLYATTPGSIVVRKGAGSDLDLTALTGRFEPDASVIDYSTRVVLLGRTEDNGAIATGSAELDVVPYVDLHGNPVRFVRLISESDQTEGSVQARSQLQLNRFARTSRSLKVTAERYETDGAFVVGDNAYVYDPDTGLASPDYEVSFRGQVLHPDVIRVVGVTWPVSADHTVAFRTQAGEWIDLTRWVVWETGENELTLGDLPRSLLGGGGNPILDRTATPLDTIAPNPPTGLTLSSWTAEGADGRESGFIDAAWTPPTTNVDGSVVTDLSHYLVAWRYTSGPRWQYATVAATEATLQATVGLPYEVFVGAYDRSNNFSGWSAAQTITVSADSTAPNAPADPLVTDYLMQLRIEYLGVDVLGDPMPADAARVDVEVASDPGGPWTVVWSLSPFVPGVAYATAPTDTTTYARLVAYDLTGNASTPSGVVSGSSSKIVGDDILDGAVGTAKLADLAVVTAKIGELDLNNGRVGNLQVGKIDGGILNAGVVIAGSLSTTPTAGGRYVSITADAIEGWADSTTQTVRLDGESNLLTGTTQTAVDGRRIVMGAAGATGEISFYAPDGTRSIIRAWTEGDGVTEAIQFGIPIGGDPLWNLINYNSSSRGEYATYRSGSHEFVFDTGAHQIDLLGNPNGGRFVVYETVDRAQGATDVANEGVRMLIDKNGERHYLNPGDYFHIYERTADPAVSRTRLQIDSAGFTIRDTDNEVRLLVNANVLLSAKDAGGTPRGRLYVHGGVTTFYQGDPATTGLLEFQAGAQVGGTSGYLDSEKIRFVTPTIPNGSGVYVGILKYTINANGTNQGFEFRDGNDAGFIPIKTATVTCTDVVASGGVFATGQGHFDGGVWSQGTFVPSDASVKNQVQDLEPGALAKVAGTRVTRYQRRSRPGREEVGLIAQEAPAEIVRTRDDGVLGVDLYGMAALTWAAVRELAAQVDQLRRDAA